MEAVQLKLVLSLSLSLLGLSSCVRAQYPDGNPPAVFVFGDSLVDPGNNNYLPVTLAKANFPFNGIDFKGGATGRFCNGRTVLDVVCDIIGVPYPPPYLAPATKAGNNITRGVSYASAAGGILDASGGNYIQRVSLNQQVSYFRSTLAQLQSQLGPDQTATLLAQSIFTLVIGNNDFINNYLLTDTDTKYLYDTRQYNILLLNTLDQQLTTLFNLGFRKFVVAAVGPIGCIPDQLAIAGGTTCVGTTNAQIRDYNAGLTSLLNQLNAKLPAATFLYANVYDSVNAIVENPAAFGLQVTNQGCCGGGLYNGQVPCLPTASLCTNRNAYLFWDPYHPTEAANIILANKLYSGGTDSISPMNVQQLINKS